LWRNCSYERMPQSATARAPGQAASAGDSELPTSARGAQPSAWSDSNRPNPRSAPSPAAPVHAEAIDDPYGLNDVPAALAGPEFASAASEDEELALPRRIAPIPSKPKTGPSSRRSESSGFFGVLPGIIYLIVLVALGIGFLSMLVHPRIGAYVFAVNSVLSFLVLFIYGFIGVALLPFRDSTLTGMLCWVCPPLSRGIRVQGMGHNGRGLPELDRVVWRGHFHGNRSTPGQHNEARHAANGKEPAGSGPSRIR